MPNLRWLHFLVEHFSEYFPRAQEGILLSNHEFNKTWQDCVIPTISSSLWAEARVGCDISDMFCDDNEALSTSFSTCPKWRFDVMTFCICANFTSILQHEIFAIFGKALHCIFRVTQYLSLIPRRVAGWLLSDQNLENILAQHSIPGQISRTRPRTGASNWN